MEILCFFAGTTFFYFKNAYPLGLLGLFCLFRPMHTVSLIIGFVMALLWCYGHQLWICDRGMPKTTLTADIQGDVISVPSITSNKTQFQLSATTLNGKSVRAQILLSCYQHCPNVHAGDHWQWRTKLKTPINLRNPGGFDYVRWLHSRHITWVGTVQARQSTLLPRTHHYPLLTLRESLERNLATMNADEKTLGITEALTLGMTQHIAKEQWDLFRRTGITHLIDISGEHIAFIAGITYALFQFLWKRIGLICLRYPAQKAASIMAILASVAYALIAGFSVPTQRSLITCGLMLCHYFCNSRLTIWQAWRYALLAVLLFEPHSVVMLGFYFSFIAVAILILVNQRMPCRGIRKLLLLQSACLLGLMPLSLYWFSFGSWNGMAANLLAIPWVSFIIVPLALLITFLSPWCVIPKSVDLLKWAIERLLSYLQWVDTFSSFHFNLTFSDALPPLALMLGMSALFLLPLARLFPCITVLIIASLYPRFEIIKPHDVIMDILDVGQGLSIVIRTSQHTLIYDTGMQFYQGSDMAQLAIIPYLNKQGIQHVDAIIISHPDLDHRGGLLTLEKKYPLHTLIVDDPTFYHRGMACHEYPDWQWDGVTFHFFRITAPLKNKNDHSCVLQIRHPSGNILISGDIEKSAENYLTKTYGKQLGSLVLVVPHHGSKTSSSPAFVKQVAPRYAIASYGKDNRYHFPHKATSTTYQQHHIPLYNTKSSGMIRVYLREHKPLIIKGWENNQSLLAATSTPQSRL